MVSILSAPGTPAAQAAAGTGTDTFPGSARFNNARQSDAGVATNKDEKTKEVISFWSSEFLRLHYIFNCVKF